MPNLTPQQLDSLYKKLPEDVQEAYFSANTSEVLQTIGKRNGLNIERTGQLADEVGLFMLGIIGPKDFVRKIADKLGAEKESAQKIAQEINEQIFSKIRESLKMIHSKSPKNEKMVGNNTEQPKVKEEIPTPRFEQIIKPQPQFGQTNEEPEKPKIEEMSIEKSPFDKTDGIIRERNKKGVFRSKPTVKENTKYPGGIDPYREPTN
ncbi:MAG: hypothetical protein ABII97_01725 [Patescibacteria group bacterium]